MIVMTKHKMKIQIQYPKSKCKYCGKTYTKKHNRQEYCSEHCRKEARKEQKRNWALQYYYKNKKTINTTRIGTRTIGPHKHPEDEKEQTIVQNEIDRIGLQLHF